jgi:hypothetical protein
MNTGNGLKILVESNNLLMMTHTLPPPPLPASGMTKMRNTGIISKD